jgi:hypothetical protein
MPAEIAPKIIPRMIPTIVPMAMAAGSAVAPTAAAYVHTLGQYICVELVHLYNENTSSEI